MPQITWALFPCGKVGGWFLSGVISMLVGVDIFREVDGVVSYLSEGFYGRAIRGKEEALRNTAGKILFPTGTTCHHLVDPLICSSTITGAGEGSKSSF